MLADDDLRDPDSFDDALEDDSTGNDDVSTTRMHHRQSQPLGVGQVARSLRSRMALKD